MRRARHYNNMNLNIILLIIVTIIWGTTFPLLRTTGFHLNGLETSTLRFVVAAVCLLPFALKASRKVWRDGAILGSIALLSYVTQAYGLELISSNRSAFITSLNVLMVPFLGLMFGQRLSLQVIIAACLACTGIGLMSWNGAGDLSGDLATLGSALAYALYIILLSRFARSHNPITLAAALTVVMALLCIVAMVATGSHNGTLSTLLVRAEPVWKILVFLGVVASAGTLFLQALAQQKISAEKAAVIYALEPVFASVFGWWWLAETMTPQAALGAAIVVLAVVAGEWNFRPKAQSSTASMP